MIDNATPKTINDPQRALIFPHLFTQPATDIIRTLHQPLGMRGFEDAIQTYHEDKSCTNIVGDPVRLIAMTKAMKWDKSICENCVDK